MTNSQIILPRRYYTFAKVALELARANNNNGMNHNLCALTVNKNQVLSVGYNSRKTHTIMSSSRMKMLHAECDALLRCGDPTDADIIVARLKWSGCPGMAKPCIVCQNILRRAGIRRVIFTLDCESADDLQLGEMRP